MNYNKIILISLDTLRADGINFNPLNLYKKEYEINVRMEKSLLDDLASKSFFFNKNNKTILSSIIKINPNKGITKK